MKTFYYIIASKDRMGNKRESYRKAEATSKADIKRRYRGTGLTVGYIWTEEELNELRAEVREKIIAKAI